MSLRTIVLTISLAVTLASIPQVALAATTYTDTVAGRELFATPTLGVFAGTATGQLPGSWYATVQHTPLSQSATITGGSFALSTSIKGEPATVKGTFIDGSVVQTGGFTGCVNQTYAVNGTLTNVGVGGGDGTGTFVVTLTHYRTTFFGYCVTYKAIVVGSVTLTFTAP